LLILCLRKTSRISPLEDYEASRFSIELLYKPSIPDNITNWRVFEGDEQIISFLTNKENFKDLAIDDEVFQKMLVEQEDVEHNIDKENNMTQPKLHTVPRGVFNLENIFFYERSLKIPRMSKLVVLVLSMKS
jgi:hypothetical protein